MTFSGPSISGEQLFGECTVPGRLHPNHLPSAICSISQVRHKNMVSSVSPLESWYQGVTHLAEVKHPGFQKDVFSNWEPATSLVEDAGFWEPRLEEPLAFWLWLLACLSDCSGEEPVCSPLTLLWYLLNSSFYEWARLQVRAFHGKLLLLFSSLEIPQFGLLSHVSCLRFSSGHSGPVLTLSTDYKALASLSSPCSLVVNASVWAILPWQLHLGMYFPFCLFVCLFVCFLPVM